MCLGSRISYKALFDRHEKHSGVYDHGPKQLARFEPQLEVMRVIQHICINTTRVDVILSDKSIWFHSKMSCVVPNQVVESGQIIRPLNLLVGELFHGCKVLEVVVIREYQYGMGRALQAVLPLLKGFKD